MIRTTWKIVFLCAAIGTMLPQALPAQTAAFVCRSVSDRGVTSGPPVAGFDFGNVFTGGRYELPSGTFFTGEIRFMGFICSNVQSTPVAFTGLDLVSRTGDPDALHVWGYCVNWSCIDGTPPGTIAPGANIGIPAAFIPSAPGFSSQTYTILNGNGLPTTTLTVSGNAITASPIPTLKPAGFIALAVALGLFGAAAVFKR